MIAAVLCGVLGQGCYADWRYLRDARNQAEPAMVQQIKALQQQNQHFSARRVVRPPDPLGGGQ